jgi:hypothetical protein
MSECMRNCAHHDLDKFPDCMNQCFPSPSVDLNIPKVERFKLESQTDVVLWLIIFVISLLVIYLISQRNHH